MLRKSFKWKQVFLFCLGLFIASSFAMKWMEPDLIYRGAKISIFGLELFYPKEKIITIFSGIDGKVRTILGYHLSFDFVFMAGCFPGIASLCMMAAQKVRGRPLTILLVALASAQGLAWILDIVENYYLLKWLKNPVIGNEFSFYHGVVYTKWTIALAAVIVLTGVLIGLLFKKKNPNSGR